MDAVVAIGEQLINHPDRIGPVTAVGLDETLFARRGPFRRQSLPTQIVDVRRGQLLDVVPAGACRWLEVRPQPWRAAVEWATLDLSASGANRNPRASWSQNDPLWRARRRLLMGRERLTDDQHDKLMGLLATGDPHQELWFSWNACDVVRQIYDLTDH